MKDQVLFFFVIPVLRMVPDTETEKYLSKEEKKKKTIFFFFNDFYFFHYSWFTVFC